MVEAMGTRSGARGMKLPQVKIGLQVFDRWWPWRIGVIVKKSRTRVWVQFSPSEVTRFDFAHLQFLEPL